MYLFRVVPDTDLAGYPPNSYCRIPDIRPGRISGTALFMCTAAPINVPTYYKLTVLQVPVPDKEPNTVIDVQSVGYILHGRTIRQDTHLT